MQCLLQFIILEKIKRSKRLASINEIETNQGSIKNYCTEKVSSILP